MIDLHTANTPNGQKIVIALEELSLQYTMHKLNLGALDQKAPDYLKINPNGRIPAIVDKEANDLAVFESGAILVYLAEKTGQLLASDIQTRSETMQWLMFQMSALGPIMGQAGWFLRSAPEPINIAIERYQNETRRLFSVLENRLTTLPYLAGANYSIADISTWTWARRAEYAEVDGGDFPHVQKWVARIAERPAVQSAMQKIANE